MTSLVENLTSRHLLFRDNHLPSKKMQLFKEEIK